MPSRNNLFCSIDLSSGVNCNNEIISRVETLKQNDILINAWEDQERHLLNQHYHAPFRYLSFLVKLHDPAIFWKLGQRNSYLI